MLDSNAFGSPKGHKIAYQREAAIQYRSDRR